MGQIESLDLPSIDRIENLRFHSHPQGGNFGYTSGMASPDYLICLECETPSYVFEWKGDKVTEALCLTCGNEDLLSFASEEEYEALSSDTRYTKHR